VIRVVLDTGVYVSGVIARGGPPDQILRAWRRNAIEVIASPMLLDELQRVLARPSSPPTSRSARPRSSSNAFDGAPRSSTIPPRHDQSPVIQTTSTSSR